MNNKETKQLMEFVGKATIEYGCSNFMKNIVLATLPAGTGSAVKFVTLLGGRLMGMKAGEETAAWTVEKVKTVIKAVNEQGLVGIIM